MPAKTTQNLLSKKEVCVTRTIAITADNFSFISFPDLSRWRCQNGKCYLYVRDTVTWDWAQQRCRSRNATLVTISSSSENSFVGSLIKTNIWIGLNDRVEAGTWDYIFLRYLLAQIRTQTVIFQWNEELYKMQYEQYRKEMRQKTCLVGMYWSASYIFDGMLFETHVSGYFLIRNLSFLDTASVHMHPVNLAYESALQSGNFWIRYESGIVWTLNPDFFFYPVTWQDRAPLRWQPRSQVVSLTVQGEVGEDTGNEIVHDGCRLTTHALLSILPEVSWVLEWIQVRVGYVWTGKFILGDPGADSGGKGKTKRTGKNGAEKSKDLRGWGKFDLNTDTFGRGNFYNPKRKSCGFKNMQIQVDGA